MTTMTDINDKPARDAPRNAITTARRLAESDNQYSPVAVLNGNWRVIECAAGIQWILQRRHGPSRWDGRSFCRTKEALIRCCHEHAGAIDATAAATLTALPGRFEEKPPGEAFGARQETISGLPGVSV